MSRLTFLYEPPMSPSSSASSSSHRVRPSPDQLIELKSVYAISPHPPRQAREALGRKIGMRYQSVTNWFQNQRSNAKRRHLFAAPPPPPHITMTPPSTSYSPSPSPPPMPTTTRRDPVKDIIVAQAAARQQLHELALPFSRASILHTTPPSPSSSSAIPVPTTPTTMLNIALPTSHRPHTPALLSSFQVSRPSSPTYHDSPAGGLGLILTCRNDADTDPQVSSAAALLEQVPRGKRSRPTPGQLVALRRLHALTDSPTIEERIQLGNEIGMELGKVTNWFRNLRQTARKKEKRARESVAETSKVELASHPATSSSKRRHDEAHAERKRPKREAYPAPSFSSPSPRDARSSLGSDDDLTAHPYRRHLPYDDPDRHSILSETDSSASHEAVTPPPHPAPALPDVGSPAAAPAPKTQIPMLEPRPGDPSVDDALLLLAFREGR